MAEEIEVGFWWVPQIPMPEFEFRVSDIRAGALLAEAFAEYDLFQLNHRVKPDYCNAGGIRFRHADFTDGEWWDVPEDEDELSDLISEMRRAGINTAPLRKD